MGKLLSSVFSVVDISLSTSPPRSYLFIFLLCSFVRIVFLSLDRKAKDSCPQKRIYLNFLDNVNTFIREQNTGNLFILYKLVYEQK